MMIKGTDGPLFSCSQHFTQRIKIRRLGTIYDKRSKSCKLGI